MMTQEEYVNGVLALKRQGKTITESPRGWANPATISSSLKRGGPPLASQRGPGGADDRTGGPHGRAR